MTTIQPSPMGLLLAHLKVRKPVENHTTDKRRDEDSACNGTGLLERPDKGRNRPISEPVKPTDNELCLLVEQVIIMSVPVIKDNKVVRTKDGAQAIVDSLGWKLTEDYSETNDKFKINTTQVLFIILDKQSLDNEIKSKAFDLLIKLAKDPSIEVMTAGCEKLLDIHKEHGLPPRHVQSVTNCLIQTRRILSSNNKYPALLQRIINAFESE